MTTDMTTEYAVDEYPVSHDGGSANLYMEQGEEVAQLLVTDHPQGYGALDGETERVTSVDLELDEEALLALAIACAKGIKAIGSSDARASLAELIGEVATLLA